jgi:uncharacterized membrane protein YphA (DoxX/SURF4 family)
MSAVRTFLRSEWLTLRLQVGLGIVFLVAAWPKLTQPPVFAKNVWAYDLLPDVLVTLMAVTLPAVELVVGLALVLGVWPRAAAWLAALMLVQFIVALAINAWIREIPVNCSCFDLNPAPKTCSQLLLDMKMLILRDFAFLAMALHVIHRRSSAARPDLATPAS